MLDRTLKIYIAGHKGMVGSAILRKFKSEKFQNIVLRTSDELDLRNQQAVQLFFKQEKPDIVVLAAAHVGGIMANIQSPAVFLYDNLMIQNNVIHFSYLNGVRKLLFLGSSCIYPRLAPQPMKEEYLLDGKVEPTNEGYAMAKIAGIKLCEMYNRQYETDYISAMPCNLFGYEDNFDSVSSHVVPALIKKYHRAKIEDLDRVEVWGTGKARRELLFVDDLADACLFLLENYHKKDFINVGMGIDVSIRELADLISCVVGYKGETIFDTTKPDGMPQKLMDVSRLSNIGWTFKTSLCCGLELTYQWYLENYNKFENNYK